MWTSFSPVKMMKKDWKKQLKRVRDIADKNFARNEKPESEQLSETLVRLEQQIDHFKHGCQAIGKKLLGCLQLHGVEPDKRLKKLPDFALAKQLSESSMNFDEKGAIRKMLVTCSDAQDHLAKKLVEYEDNVELKVLHPLQIQLEQTIPNIFKLKKQVAKQAQEVEAHKSRLAGISRQTVTLDRTQEVSRKAEQIREDMEEAENKLELFKDQLAIEMFNFQAREGQFSNIFTELIESQLKYHHDAVSALQKVLPEMKRIEQSARYPVFGCSLEGHLRQTKLPVATVISECVTALIGGEGLTTEGLFRIAGGNTKTKKLKAAFDAGLVDMEEYMADPHCISGALKQYLRELPEPLMTFDLFSDWANAASLPSDQRVKAIANTLNKMRKPHFDNLKYIIQFLSKLAENSEINKMSSSNLAIVIGPSLLWPKDVEAHNMLTTGVQNAVTETMISNASVLFGDDLEFAGDSISSPMSRSQTSHDSSATTKSAPAAIAKVDSSDSLSSDSLGADGFPVSNTSSVYSCDLSSVTTSAEADASTLVAPKRSNRKAQAPLPPSQEPMLDNTSFVSGSAALALSRPQMMPGDREMPSSSSESTSVPTAQKAATGTPSLDDTETSVSNHNKQQNVLEPSGTATSDTVSSSIKSSQFASYQAMVGGVLNRPAKTLLSRPNTAYMDNAKLELMKTADEQHDDAIIAPRMVGGKASQDSTSGTEVEESWRLGGKQDPRFPPFPKKSSSGSEEYTRKKPERPMKPSRPASSDSDTNGTKSKPEALKKFPSDDSNLGDSSSANEQVSDTSGTLPTTGSKASAPEVPDVASQRSSGATVTCPPTKPPPPAVPGPRSPGVVQEDTYL